MATTFTGPHHGPRGVDETFTKLRNKSTKTDDGSWGGYWTSVSAHVWYGELNNHTPTTTWAGPGDTQRPGVTPAPDRIGPFTVDEVMAAAYADCPWWINKDGFAQWVSAVLRRLYSEVK